MSHSSCPLDMSSGYCLRNVPLGDDGSQIMSPHFLKMCSGQICSQSDLAPKPMPEQSKAPAHSNAGQKKMTMSSSRATFSKNPVFVNGRLKK